MIVSSKVAVAVGVEEASTRRVSVRYWRSKPLKEVRAEMRLYLDGVR